MTLNGLRTTSVTLLALAGLVGCQVTVSNDDGVGGGTSSSSSDSSSSGSNPSCSVFEENPLTLAITPPPSAPPVDPTTCDDSTPPLEFDGTVHYVDGVLNVDACPPNADCLASNYAISIGGPAFALDAPAIPEGTFVHVLWSFCHRGLLVHNLPSFGGVTNPVATHESLWLAVSVDSPVNGFAKPDDYAGLAFDSSQNQCMEGVTGHPNGLYKLDVSSTESGEHVVVDKGTRGLVTFGSGAHAGEYAVANVLIGNLGIVTYFNQYTVHRLAP